jgi:hypothetical protein
MLPGSEKFTPDISTGNAADFVLQSYWMLIVILQLAGRGYLNHLSLILQLDCSVKIQHRISVFIVVKVLI